MSNFVQSKRRLGCVGSLLVTVVLSALMFLLMRGCSSPPNGFSPSLDSGSERELTHTRRDGNVGIRTRTRRHYVQAHARPVRCTVGTQQPEAGRIVAVRRAECYVCSPRTEHAGQSRATEAFSTLTRSARCEPQLTSAASASRTARVVGQFESVLAKAVRPCDGGPMPNAQTSAKGRRSTCALPPVTSSRP
jgi:hypothetical protein